MIRYEDQDNGETLEYCGTTSKDSTPTTSTKYLEQSYTNHEAIRVLRGPNKDSIYAPASGYRYDGLYIITNKQIIDQTIAKYRFTLQRVAGQDPIRYQGVDKRPTTHELIKKDDIDRWMDTL